MTLIIKSHVASARFFFFFFLIRFTNTVKYINIFSLFILFGLFLFCLRGAWVLKQPYTGLDSV